MRSHLQAPQGNCNEDLTSFPFKGNKKEAENVTIVGERLTFLKEAARFPE